MKRRLFISLCIGLMALLVTPALAQNQTFKGTVVDETGEPIIGASVIVEGQKGSGTITDMDGNYTIQAPKGAKVTISYIGYLSQTVKPGGQIKLKEDSQNLEEVVVVGYGTQKKAHLTGSISTVDMNDVQDLSGAGLASSLSGLVNGMSVQSGSDRAGSTATIRIRDTNDVGDIKGLTQRSQSPLYVIDGYVYPNDIKVGNSDGGNPGEEAFNNLDPSEVESISVLKDASAAVYGSRAANGVILVTTKRGKMGQPRISYSGTFGITNAIGRPEMLNSYDYGRLYNIMKAANIIDYPNLDKRTSFFQKDELDAMRGLDFDLLDKYWKTGYTQQHSVNVSGGTDVVNYFAGLAYFKQDGNLGKLDYDRWNYRAGVDVKISKSLKANLTVSGNYANRNKPNINSAISGNAGEEGDYRALLYRPRYIPEYVNGLPILSYGPSDSQVSTVQRYHYELMQNNGDYSENKNSNMTINGSLEYNFDWLDALKGLTLRFSYSKNITNDKSNQYGSQFTLYKMSDRFGSGNHLYTPVGGEDLGHYYSAENFDAPVFYNGSKPYLSRDMSRADNYQMNFTINYSRKFGDHDVSGLFSIEKSETETEWLKGQVAFPYSFTNHQSNGAANTKEYAPQWTRYEAGTLSYIGRVNYAYLNRYLFEFLVRADASTKFAPDNYWGTFPSVSVGWVASEEPWFQNIKWLKWVDYFKLRMSYGLTGRDNTPAWQWMKNYDLYGKPGVVIGTTADAPRSQVIRLNNDNAAVNEDIHWDKSYKFNVGFDLHTLNRRLAIGYEFYYTRNREMFMNLSQEVPGTVGALSAYTNVGEIDAWGHELSITWRDKIGKDFKYKIGLNTGYSDNEVRKADFDPNYKYRTLQAGMRSDVGIWGMQCLGMFRSQHDIDEYFDKYMRQYDENGVFTGYGTYMGKAKSQVFPGMLIYKDVRGPQLPDGTYAGPDGKVDANDDQVQLSKRSTNPWGFTLNMNAEWKGISLTAQFAASWGSYAFIPSQALKPYYGIEATNMPSFWNPDDVYVYQDIYDDKGNLLQAMNHNAYYPNPAFDINATTSDFWRVNGAIVRLNRLTLAYAIPQQWLKSLGIGVQSVRFNVTGQNLINFYNPYPDHFASNWSSYGSYPRLRKWTIGVNVSF